MGLYIKKRKYNVGAPRAEMSKEAIGVTVPDYPKGDERTAFYLIQLICVLHLHVISFYIREND